MARTSSTASGAMLRRIAALAVLMLGMAGMAESVRIGNTAGDSAVSSRGFESREGSTVMSMHRKLLKKGNKPVTEEEKETMAEVKEDLKEQLADHLENPQPKLKEERREIKKELTMEKSLANEEKQEVVEEKVEAASEALDEIADEAASEGLTLKDLTKKDENKKEVTEDMKEAAEDVKEELAQELEEGGGESNLKEDRHARKEEEQEIKKEMAEEDAEAGLEALEEVVKNAQEQVEKVTGVKIDKTEPDPYNDDFMGRLSSALSAMQLHVKPHLDKIGLHDTLKKVAKQSVSVSKNFGYSKAEEFIADDKAIDGLATFLGMLLPVLVLLPILAVFRLCSHQFSVAYVICFAYSYCAVFFAVLAVLGLAMGRDPLTSFQTSYPDGYIKYQLLELMAALLVAILMVLNIFVSGCKLVAWAQPALFLFVTFHYYESVFTPGMQGLPPRPFPFLGMTIPAGTASYFIQMVIFIILRVLAGYTKYPPPKKDRKARD
mmetsp:Transcript_59944/g.190409  ORF Transcript_59944/g.190409 Transcript_59944/m.190409 type:complete len:492 (-) Transcript_59944:117-1592(-)|eukprot:CAMPEP_0182913436 /NCGR_PEP_ID=MMETSP0034_2-20130328/38033_1 /TAXON_ID=156128 /ORGANISM="Nephroselmis pyriformis, Strain CCMP717" /LENGTH=491 /DNA_ID=CAMNT_0025050161 /DNA_START=191 /DNA_END=1666 /DNA_ORIENTATION=+